MLKNIVKNVKVKLMDFAKNNIFFRGVFRKLLLLKTKAKYFSYKVRYKMDNKTVLFETFGGRSYACSPKAIYEKMDKWCQNCGHPLKK